MADKYFFVILVLMLAAMRTTAQKATERRTLKLMGSRFDITIVGPDPASANTYIDEAIAEIQRLEAVISSWSPQSQTSQVNANAGIAPVQVDPELFDLIQRCKYFSKLTNGAYDISYASIDKVWHFDGTMTGKPTPEAIAKSVAKIGYEKIILDPENHTVFLRDKGMKIGFGSIGKGFAADQVRRLMIAKGVEGGIINASGDLTTWGKQPNGKDWMVGITNPLSQDKVFSWFPVVDAAVATSGNYEKFVEFDGVKYSHIIDPRTGYPATGLTSVTIFAKSAELCDALATSVFVMGRENGMDLIDQMNGVECIIIDDRNEVYTSEHIQLNQTK